MKSSMVCFSVSAPGKVILYGEHSVVYGKLALAASIGLRTYLTLKENCESELVVTFSDEKFNFQLDEVEDFLKKTRCLNIDYLNPDSVDYDSLLSLVETFLYQKELKNNQFNTLKTFFLLLGGIMGRIEGKLSPISINITTELNIGAGTGSSASFSVCLAASFLYYVKLKLKLIDNRQFNNEELETVSKWSFCAEKIIHGTPSGLDNTICTFGNVVEFRKGTKPKLVPLNCPLKILLVNTKVPRETKKMVANVRQLYDEKPGDVERILDSLERIAQDALNNLINLNGTQETDKIYKNLRDLSKENHSLLRDLGVSHRKLEEIVGILEEFHLGGKLTGAGGGGYAFCFLPPHFKEFEIDSAINKLNSNGFHAVIADLGGPGVKIVVS